MQDDDSLDTRLSSQRAFFDRKAKEGEAVLLKPISPKILNRYSHAVLRNSFMCEFTFKLFGNLRGKKVLDVGCGTGTGSVLLARLGAVVTGVDLSVRSVDIAKQRAVLDGVDDRTRFIAESLEGVELPTGEFDIVWGDAILHHVIPSLDTILDKLFASARVNALVIFAEPVTYCKVLRRIRAALPVSSDATKDERPLERAEINQIKQRMADARLKFYNLFGRVIDRYILTSTSYEEAGWLRKLIVDLIAKADEMLFALPLVWRLAGYCVIYGHPQRSGRVQPLSPR